MTQTAYVPIVEIWAKLREFSEARKLTVRKSGPIGPRLRDWCEHEGYTLESWTTVYED